MLQSLEEYNRYQLEGKSIKEAFGYLQYLFVLFINIKIFFLTFLTFDKFLVLNIQLLSVIIFSYQKSIN